MEKEAALLESGKENEDLCSFYEDELTELYSSCGSDTVETCCLLERLRNAKDYVTFTLDMEDYYRIKDAETDKKNDSKN